MTYPPPPPTPETEMNPQRQQQPQSQGLFLPVDKLMGFAKSYAKYHGIIKWGAKMAHVKIPPEIDEIVNMLNDEGPNPQAIDRLNQFAGSPQQQYGPQQEEWQPPGQGQQAIEPRIGERVLTHDLAYRAWLMNKKQGISLRDIAIYFTDQLGAPCSHATIAEYVNQVDEEMSENSMMRRASILRGALLVVVPAVAVFVVEHFLKW